MAHTMLLASNYIQARYLNSISAFDKTAHSFQCDVIFGSPSADCRGTGICKITGTVGRSVSSAPKECRRTRALLVENEGGDGLSLIFFHSQLCTQLYRRHFWKGILKMDEACPIPDELRQLLSIPYSSIQPGRYGVSEGNGFIRVYLDCAL